MTKTTDFQLKAGAVITFFGSPIAYTNANLSDDVAFRKLAENVNNVRLFSQLPSNWEDRLEDYKKNRTNDNGSVSSKESEKISMLEAQLAEVNALKTAAEDERDSIKSELAGANSSLESALSERDELKVQNETLKAQNEALTAERDRLLAEVEALKAKSTARSKKTTSATAKENASPVSSEQSLDLGE